MSLPDCKSLGKQSHSIFQLNSSVVQLNVGGHVYCTSLSTLRKFPNSKLADMFTGHPKLQTDAGGRFFIDRDGTHFKGILDFLRTQRLPTEHVQEVYQEALFYDVKPLVKLLEETPQLFGEMVGRQQFLARVPNYQENLEVIIKVARAEAIASRTSSMIVCILRTEEDASRYSDAIGSLDNDKESVVCFGPWKAPSTVEDLLDCIKMDIEAKGYKITLQPYVAEKGFRFKSYDFFYRLTFTWW